MLRELAMLRRHKLIVQGEVTAVLSALRGGGGGGGGRWIGMGRSNSEEIQDPLIHDLCLLQDNLLHTQEIGVLDIVRPFCSVVINEETTGPITGLAIGALDKFLASGLLDPSYDKAAHGICEVAEAVTHARFVGTSTASDEVVLMKILKILNTLLSVPGGRLLTNESVCEIMQSCFRICFEGRLSELLHCFAENILTEMVRLLFSNLSLVEDTPTDNEMKVVAYSSGPVLDSTSYNAKEEKAGQQQLQSEQSVVVQETDSINGVAEGEEAKREGEDEGERSGLSDEEGKTGGGGGREREDVSSLSSESPDTSLTNSPSGDSPTAPTGSTFTTARGVHFAGPVGGGGGDEREKSPHSMPCVREVLRFLISIINPKDRNDTRVICIGLDLVTVMLECGGKSLGDIKSLRVLMQDGLCYHLLTLLKHDSVDVFGRSLRNCFLLFDSNRHHLKLQLEWFLNRLMQTIQLDQSRLQAGRQELTLECLIQFCHIRNFVSELYVNYDCSTYCTNVCERLSKLLAKQAFPSSYHTISSTNILALDTLLAMILSLESTSTTTDNNNNNDTNDGDTNRVGAKNGGKVPADCNEGVSVNSSAGIIFSSAKQQAPDISLNGGEEVGGAISEPNLLKEEEEEEEERKHLSLPLSPSPGTLSELLKARQLKKLITAGTEQFNQKPSRGISFLMEQGVLQTPLDPVEVATFLHDNPSINKQMLGDYLGDRRNTEILVAFIKSFKFHSVSLVEAIREFLESFRLPGEAPVISGIFEKFSAHWMSCNEGGLATMFANQDAIFVLCYAIMMLNTDLHNPRLKQKMSLEEFIRSRRGMNNNKDFPRELLTEIYHSIRTTEIILPSEHHGAVKEGYEWKVLLRHASTNKSLYYEVSTHEYDQDVFLLLWGSVAAALSCALENWPPHSNLYDKITNGYKQCSIVAAHYEQHEVFDNLVISLSKFSSLLSHHDPPLSQSVTLTLTTDTKAHLSLQTMLSLAHRHGNLLREGWKNILDCLMCLYRARLLPESMVTIPDFINPAGSVSLYAEEAPTVRPDSSILSSFFSVNYWLLAGEASVSTQSALKSLSPSEVKQRNALVKWIDDCGCQLLFSDSKFLNEESLAELIKALIFQSHGPDVHNTLGTGFDEESAIFFLELLMTVTLANRDRVNIFLEDVLNHLTAILLSDLPCRRLRERIGVSLLQLSIRLLHKENTRQSVLAALRSLLLLKPAALVSHRSFQRQIGRGLGILMRSQANYLSSYMDWLTVFSLLEFTATCTSTYSNLSATNPTITAATEEGNETTDYESQPGGGANSPTAGKDWVVIQRQRSSTSININCFDLLVEDTLPPQDPESFFIACDVLSYIIREEQLVNANNFTTCLKTVRLLSEVTSVKSSISHDQYLTRQQRAPPPDRSYAHCALRLLDLLDTLYHRTTSVFNIEGISSDTGAGVSHMWNVCWCPLLEGVARMCCDPRKNVRQASIAYLQRELLAQTLQSLTALDWEACFLEVFFPMLSRLIEEDDSHNPDIEEGQMRACNLLCKVFLQRLQLISSLDNFTDLWVGILDTMDRYMHIEGSELLPEAIPESLKNMLLVMVTQGVLYVGTSPPTQEEETNNQLWTVTWKRVERFLPQFLSVLFPESIPTVVIPSSSPVIEQPRPKPTTPTQSDVSPSSSPLSQSPSDDGSSFPILVIHPPLPTPTLVPTSPNPPSPPLPPSPPSITQAAAIVINNNNTNSTSLDCPRSGNITPSSTE